MVEYSSGLLDLTYGALAHPVRREVLLRLREGAATVTALAEPFDFSLAGVSKHIKVLEEASLVNRQVLGREHHLSLAPVPLQDASDWLLGYRAFWEGRLDALDDLLRGGEGRGRSR